MFGAIERPRSWARHMVRTRALQTRDRGLHRVRPPPLRAHGVAHLPPAPGPARPDLPRDPAHARRGAHRLPGMDLEHPGELGEDGGRGCRPGAAGRGQRPGRHPHGREHLACRGRQSRPAAWTRRDSAPWSSPWADRSSSARPSTVACPPPAEVPTRRGAGSGAPDRRRCPASARRGARTSCLLWPPTAGLEDLTPAERLDPGEQNLVDQLLESVGVTTQRDLYRSIMGTVVHLGRGAHRRPRPEDGRRGHGRDGRGVPGVPALPPRAEGHLLRLGPDPARRPALRPGPATGRAHGRRTDGWW